MKNLFITIIFIGAGYWLFFTPEQAAVPAINTVPTASFSSTPNQQNCLIKGNISYNTGEKIYHLPSDAYYDRTVINEVYGERWFCTEAEAQVAGWRHAYR